MGSADGSSASSHKKAPTGSSGEGLVNATKVNLSELVIQLEGKTGGCRQAGRTDKAVTLGFKVGEFGNGGHIIAELFDQHGVIFPTIASR